MAQELILMCLQCYVSGLWVSGGGGEGGRVGDMG